MDKRKQAENAGLDSSTSKIVRIGVLGGVGPEATAEFYRKLIKSLQKRGLIKSNSDFPQIIINSIPAPELVFDEINDEVIRPYVDGIKFLDKSGVDFIVMVCNTIHLYYDELQKEIKTPILDLREEVKKALRGKKRVLVLGTPAAIKNRLYDFPGVKYSRLTNKEMAEISESILRFNRGETKGRSKNIVHPSRTPANICEKHLKEGTQIILACTELSLALEKEGIGNISTLDVLVGATIDKFLSLKYQGRKYSKKRVGKSQMKKR